MYHQQVQVSCAYPTPFSTAITCGFLQIVLGTTYPQGGCYFTQVRPQDTYALNLAFYLTMYLKLLHIFVAFTY